MGLSLWRRHGCCDFFGLDIADLGQIGNGFNRGLPALGTRGVEVKAQHDQQARTLKVSVSAADLLRAARLEFIGEA